MKHLFFFCFAIFSLIANRELQAQTKPGGNILVAYFSWGGNTRAFAEEIQKQSGGTIFEIKTVQAYPQEPNQIVDFSRRELNANTRPALASQVDNMDLYNVVFVGYPIWWGVMPMGVLTFLETYNFAGKTIIPFCTHNNSRLGSSVSYIRRLCPNATILDGLAVRGGTRQITGGSFELGSATARANLQRDVTAWIRRIGITS